MCNRRCCCPGYYGRCTPAAGGSAGWRGFKSIGAYPHNVITVNTTPGSTDGLPTAGTGSFAIDQHNRFTFQSGRIGGTLAAYYMEDMKLASRQLVATWPIVSGAGGGAFCPDWQHKRLYYVRGLIAPSTGVAAVQQIRRVNYDGTNDTLLATETATPTGIGNFDLQVFKLVWCPTNNCLYYLYEKQSTTDIPSSAYYLKKMNADDGSGNTAIITLDGTLPTPTNLRSFGIGVRAARIVYIEQTANSPLTQYLRLADLGGAVLSTLYSGPQVASGPGHNIFKCKFNEQENIIYLEDQTSNPFDKTTLYKVPLTATSDADWQQVLNSLQGLGSGASIGFNPVRLDIKSFAFGCKTEYGDGQYVGSGYSVEN